MTPLNPKLALVLAGQGQAIDIEDVPPAYREVVTIAVNANGNSAAALEGYRLSGPKAAAVIAELAKITPDDESWELPDPPRDRHGLVWRTAVELAAEDKPDPEPVVQDYIALGVITELTAPVKVGKTRLLGEMVKATTEGRDFLGRATRRGPWVWLTEERPATFNNMLSRVGLLDCEDLTVQMRHDVPLAMPWPEIMEAATEEAQRIGAVGIIVDTVAKWAGLKGDEENQSGPAMAAMQPLEMAAAQGLAVISSRHDRKGGGEIGESGRGSSAWGGVADVLLNLRRMGSDGSATQRRLTGVGRLADTPAELIIELDEGRGYRALGGEAAVQQRNVADVVLDLLPDASEERVTENALLELVIKGGTPTSRSSLQRAIKDLIEIGRVDKQDGSGETGRALGYWRILPGGDPRE